MKIATWNVNGIKARIDGVQTWLREYQPDIACLQEIKSVDEAFPAEPFEALGYNVVTHGQKGFNGVAIFSKIPFDDTHARLPGDDDDEQARYLEATFSIKSGAIRVVCLYLPNGNPIDTSKFPYKLSCMDRLHDRVEELLRDEIPLVVAGDYNVIPHAIDCRRPEVWANDALFQPQSRERYFKLLNLGLTDAVRTGHVGDDIYTFWDYQAGAWAKNNGIRIDHMLLSAQATDKLIASGIDKDTRAWEKPSDHVPVWIEIDDE